MKVLACAMQADAYICVNVTFSFKAFYQMQDKNNVFIPIHFSTGAVNKVILCIVNEVHCTIPSNF